MQKTEKLQNISERTWINVVGGGFKAIQGQNESKVKVFEGQVEIIQSCIHVFTFVGAGSIFGIV